MSYTSGPWKVIEFQTDKKGYISIVSDAPIAEHICDIFPFGHRPGGAKRELEGHLANAHLIAAAPDLLSALRESEKEIEAAMPDHFSDHKIEPCCCSWHDTLTVIRAAIAKAEGRS